MIDWIMPETQAGYSSGWIGGDWFEFFRESRKTMSGTFVNEHLALNYAAVWAATRVLAEPLGSLPFHLYERFDDDSRESAIDRSEFDLMHIQPNPEMGATPFRTGRAMHQINWGNGFAEIERDRNGFPVALWPIHPSRVRPALRNDPYYKDGARYFVTQDDGSILWFKSDEILHFAGALAEDGIWGKGVIAHARESIGFGMAVDIYGQRFFGTGGHPKGLLYLPGMSDKEKRREFRREFAEVHSNPQSREPVILPVEGKYDPLFTPPEDSQFLQTKTFNREEIAMWYKIPVTFLGDLRNAHYANVELLGIHFITHSLWPIAKIIEEQCNIKLLKKSERSRYFFEYNFGGFLRGDLKTRIEAYVSALQNGIMTLNEVRRLENLSDIGPEGDQHFVQLNMTTVEGLMKEIEKNESSPLLPNPFKEDKTQQEEDESNDDE